MKNILFVLPTIGFGGAEKVYIDIAHYLSEKRKFNVKLVYFVKLENERSIPSELDCICLDVTSVKQGVIKYINLINKFKPHTIFSNLEHLNIMSIFVRLVLRKSYFLNCRQTYILSNKTNVFKQFVLKIFYKYSDSIIFQSEYMKLDFLERIPVENGVVISNPINKKITSYAIQNKQFNIQNIKICFIGRLEEVKNVEYIINMFKESQKTNIELNIIGNGSQMKYLQLISEGYNIKFHGIVENPYSLISKMDIVVLASRSEGFPNVILESLALDVPVFVKKHKGGTEEIMKNMGLLDYYVEELNFSNIEELILNYPKDLSERVINIYDIEEVSKKYEKLVNRDI